MLSMHPLWPYSGARRRLLLRVALSSLLFCAAPPRAGAGELLWFADGRPTPAAQQVVDLLLAATADGLDPRDYQARALAEAIARASGEAELAADALSSLDEALTGALRSYLDDRRFGRVDPRQVGANYAPPHRDLNEADSLLASIAGNRSADETAGGLTEALPEYSQLRTALAGYRRLAAEQAWKRSLPAPPDGRLSPGQKYAGLDLLAERLRLLGDLANGPSLPARYEGRIVEAVKAFQRRHGISADGVVGRETLAQLQVPPAVRVRQIELALERLRWTPLLQAPRVIVVNVPEFALGAYEVHDGQLRSRLAMRVIVGTAGKTQTPIFDAELRFIEFSPYWNVPPSIARGETLPRLRRDPSYFDRQGFEFVDGDGRVVAGFSEAGLDAVQRGQMRIRQRPGAANALGDIKFVFPNSDNIYLHHTPGTHLFRRDRRDFSHGCIRVEAPVELARFVLAGEPEWTEERIVQAMRRGKSATIRLPEPLPVVVAYRTAVFRDGKIHFFPDIYGLDRVLDEALSRRRPPPLPSLASQSAIRSRFWN
ncbi:murein L,D-transpeptidase [Accumulibacter sp.]|uniref:L,D-transpeptidase family protein n=1 Tax=Accumulibacter sp. TaxID=2053492 RepID=UPI0025F05A3E|nr:L,D-transpeptidase family protein [Accumulibacter sp.]MCM8593869.1 L,D-transpeptidase family protein [Accumulibacter sp.]MCM8626089.1 L,D-transpeptidase family protein [Accumulibacter sp.]MDS4048010.1 L,D-transpeptidase family protein [Accumulibacter sp.]